jgi:DNA polymerase-1
LTRNALSNYPIQGVAFHCLLWSLIQLNKIGKKEGWKTKIIGQIHDSIVFDLYPPEQERVIQMAKRIMTKDIRSTFNFLTVPLEVEVELTDIDGSWYEKKVLKEK